MNITTVFRTCLATGALTAGVVAAAGPGFAIAAAEDVGETVQEVFVTNDARSPVVVDASGHTLTIDGSADVSGSMVTVQGEEGEALPVEVTNGSAPEPFQFYGAVASAYDTVVDDLFTVPADRRLTITNFSVVDALKELKDVTLFARCSGSSPYAGFATSEVFAQGNRRLVHQPTTLEVPAGCKGRISIVRDKAHQGSSSQLVTVTGHFTPVTPPAG